MGTLVKPAGRVREPDRADATRERNPGGGSGGKAERPDGLWLDGGLQYRTPGNVGGGNSPRRSFTRGRWPDRCRARAGGAR